MRTKEEIISEIRKWSTENGDRTPSEKILRQEIGIHKWEWISYWTKITDVQKECGLNPHGFDKTKFTQNELCDLFIKVIREQGRWPSRDELDFKRRQDSNFPASATFYNKLGLTKTLSKTILEYIKDKQGYEDIVGICNSVLGKYINKSIEFSDNSSETGYVYLGIQHGDYKIGFTKNLNRRREDITLLGSEPINWIHEIYTDDMRGVERYWHNRFKTKWLRGEWYNLSPSDVKAFKRWKKIF